MRINLNFFGLRFEFQKTIAKDLSLLNGGEEYNSTE